MKLEKLEQDCYYHIFNRGINGGIIFSNDENKRYFLKLIKKYLEPHVSIFAFCLLDNHFHFLIRVDSEEKAVIQAFSNLFNTYAKAFNKQQGRTGSLFEKHFRRKKLTDEAYLRNSIIYIHQNPENHKVADDFSVYPFSSYVHFMEKEKESILNLEWQEVISLFDSLENFRICHGKEQGVGSDLQSFKNLVGLNEKPGTSDKNPMGVEIDLQGLGDLAGRGIARQAGHEENFADSFYQHIKTLQDEITSKLEEIDGKARFKEDVWQRDEGGGGRTRVIEEGAVFEKGGVNISAVNGPLSKPMQDYFKVGETNFFACGLSLVLHPKNPFVPTVHANWRYFELYDKQGKRLDSWFGGGQDLTPYYLFEDDAKHFHQVCKRVCDRHDNSFYPKFKKQCDQYFWNVHRNEARGIGGLFYDYLKTTDEKSLQDWYAFVTDSGNHFLESYLPIVEKRKAVPFSDENRNWQEIRRGRYVEFNLIHDKGTLFGLKTNGRIESILMSLPPKVQWRYNFHPEPDSKEAKLEKILQNPREWIKQS